MTNEIPPYADFQTVSLTIPEEKSFRSITLSKGGVYGYELNITRHHFGGISMHLNPQEVAWLRENLPTAHEPGVGAPFPYPTDRDGWICSICHGWNGPKTRVCLHSHVPLDPQGASRDASSGEG